MKSALWRRVAVSVLLMLVAGVSSAHAGTVSVFGPRTFTRSTGSPQTERVTFTAPAGPFTLHVESDGTASAVITLNGATILGPSDFKPSAKTFDRAVTLKASNVLTVELRSKPGSTVTLSIFGNDSTPPSIRATASPAPNAAGWNRTNVTVTFDCSDALAGVASCPAPVVVSTEGAGQVITGEAIDKAGNHATASVTLNIDKTPPGVAAGALPAPNADGWNNTDVTVTFACTDALSGIAQCTAPVSITGSGSSLTASGTAVDRAGNSATATHTVNIDRTAPRIAARLSAAPNAAGWFTAPVTVTFECADDGSGMGVCPSPVTVSTEGANQVVKGVARDKAGNAAEAAATVSLDLTGPTVTATASPAANAAGWNQGDVTVTFACEDSISGVVDCPAPRTVTAEGTQTVSVSVHDRAGQVTTSAIDVRIDHSQPAIAAALAPAANAAGWNNAPVTVTFTCTDPVSGIADCTAPITIATAGAGQQTSGTAVDRAGNSASTSVTVNLDLTPPTIRAIASVSGPTNTDVTVRFECEDDLSGVAVCPEPVTVSADGSSQQVEGVAVDKAGNTAHAAASVTIDRTRPTIVATASPAPNANGWYSAPAVVVTFTCGDTGSGVVACPDPVTVAAEGANQHVSGSVSDRAGNTAAASIDINLDRTPPTIAGTASETGWTKGDVAVSFTCADALSGIDHCAEPVTVSTEGSQQITGVATDKAGNAASQAVTVTIDRTAPAITPTPDRAANAAGWYNAPVTVTFACVDALSGVASCADPATASANGPQTITGSATDHAGNAADATLTIKIDTIPPTIHAIVSPASSNGDVIVSFECADEGGSGIAVCPPQTTVSADGPASVTGEAIDNAGNHTTIEAPVQVDRTPPTITAHAARAPNANGWYNAPVRVEFVCQDAGSGIATCPAAVDVTADITGRVVSGTATDRAGNSASASLTINLDTTAPIVTPKKSPSGIWANGPVTVTFECSDAVSGIASCTSPVTISADGSGQTVNGTATDLAGNSASATTTVQIDQAPPTITITSPLAGAVVRDNVAAITGTVQDGLSGVASVNCAGTAALVTGTSFVCSATLTSGANTIAIDAADQAGNVGHASLPLTVNSNTSPVAKAGGPYTGETGTAVSFDGSQSSDPEGQALTYKWTFGDGATATGVKPTHAFTAPGSFAVDLVVTDSEGASSSASSTVTITRANRPPVANAGGPYNGDASQTITLNGSASSDPDGDTLTYAWTFGDGSSASGAVVRRAYQSPGTYTARLTVDDGRGGTNSATADVIVRTVNQRPSAQVGGPYSGEAGQLITFSGSGSDPDNDSLTYTWTFSDGSSASTAQTQHAFSAAGNFVATLTVSDGRGGTAAASAQVVVAPSNTPPVAQIVAPATAEAGSGVAFSGAGSSDADNDALTYSWKFGDGRSASGIAPTHTFTTAGTFTVSLTVTDARGASASTSAPIQITAAPTENRAPIASAGGPYNGEVNVAVPFSAAGSSDPDKDPLTYTWDFGDGSSATGAAPMHAFTEARSYTVAVTVSDGRGATSTATAAVTIAPAIDRLPPVVTIQGPQSVLPGSEARVRAVASDNQSVASVTFTVSGTAGSPITVAPYEYTVQVPAVASPGTTIPVVATARDAAGNTATAQITLTINPLPDNQNPTVALHAPSVAAPGSTIRLSATAFDNDAVDSVTFIVNNAVVAVVKQAPYEAAYVVPADAAMGSTLQAAARAADHTGNQGSASATIAVAETVDNTPPVVHVTAPATIVPGATITYSADATDQNGISAVIFTVDGARIATVTSAPYQATYAVPLSAIAGMTFHVEARAVDFAGLEAADAAQTLVTAPVTSVDGLVLGEVYDDATGLPLAGATVTLRNSNAAPVVTDDRGRFALATGNGDIAVEITSDGYTTAYRSIAAGTGVREFVDARLTPRSSSTTNLTPVLGGTLQSGPAVLVVPPGGVSAPVAASLTRVTPQGLQGLLPAGWSPVAIVDIAPAGAAFAVPASLTMPRPAGVPVASALTLARWDAASGNWRAVAAGNPGTTTLEGTVESGGQYAWLVADQVPAAPAPPVIGNAIEGVAPIAIPDGATTAVTPDPKVIFYQPGVHSSVTGVLTSPAVLPSGTRVWARISESYKFYSGAEIYPDSNVQDLFFYQVTPDGAALNATFTASPSRTFEALSLEHGVIALDLYAPAEAGAPASMIPPSGGSVELATGERLEFAQGAATTAIAASLRRLEQNDLGAPLPADVAFVGALDVTLSGGAVEHGGVISIPKPGDLATDAQVLVARIATVQERTRLVLVAIAHVDGARLVAEPRLPLNDVEMEGVRTSGRYVFVRPAQPVGFVAGRVLNQGNSGVAGALVSTETFSVVAVSRNGGPYVAAAMLGNATLTAVNLVTSDRGTGTVTLASAGDEAALDLLLVAEPPRVISATPASNATAVALSSAVVAIFSEPIAPATVSGANAGNVVLAAGDAPVAGAISLSGGNTLLTFRSAEALAPNTTYTFTLAPAITDATGEPMGTPFVLTFKTLDTTAPTPPPAGSLSATIPEGGQTTITGTQGTAGQHDTVTIENITRGTSTPVLLDPNGGFLVKVQASAGDVLKLKIVDEAGNETVVDLPTFTRQNADGSISGVVGATGGHIDGPNGTAVDVPKGALPDGTIVTVKSVDESVMPDVMTPEQKQAFPFAGGLQLDFGGATPAKYVNVSVPPKPEDKPGDQWIVAQVMQVGGQDVFNTVDTAKLIDGRVRTSSPPCPGVLAASTYGIYKSTQPVGLAWGRMYSNGSYDGLRFGIGFATTSTVLPIMFPVYAWENPREICLPVLSGRVTVGPNTTRLMLKPGALRADEREIIVKNVTNSGAESHFRRDLLEYAFEVAGKQTDSFSAAVVSVGGQTTAVTSVDVRPGPAGKVVVALDADSIDVSVSKVVIKNLSADPVTESQFGVADLAFELSVGGGLDDFYWITVVDSNGVSRRIEPDFYEKRAGVNGPGNLLAKAITGTIDPTRDEIIAAQQPGDPAPSKWRDRVELIAFDPVTKQEQRRQVIPADRIVHGGFQFAFEGESFWDYQVDVIYNTGERETVVIPRLRLVVQNAQTGTVVKTIEVQAPPKDEPLGVGAITDDSQPPLLTSSPVKMNSFDPAMPLTFAFSEAMDADSIRQNAIVEHVTASGARERVSGTWRIYGQNRTATFVPDAPLRIGEEYSITFLGADSLGGTLSPGSQPVTDLGGNSIATTRLQLKTFTPRLVTSVTTGRNGRPMDEIYDIDIRRTDEDGKSRTYLYATTNAWQDGPKLLVFDASDAEKTKEVGFAYGSWIQKQLTLVTDLGKNGNPPLKFRAKQPLPTPPAPQEVCGGEGPEYTGDLAVSVGTNVDFSFVDVFYPGVPTTDPVDGGLLFKPCLITSKLLTANPDTLNIYTTHGTTHISAFAEGVATIRHSEGIAVFTAVRDAGLFVTDIGSEIPQPFPQDRKQDSFVSGDYYDVVAFQDRLLAANNGGRSLDIFDANLAQLGSVPLAGGGRHVVTAENYGVDENGDGLIKPDEVRNLAFVATRNCPPVGGGCRYGIDIVDLRNFSDPRVIGTIPMPGFTFGLDIDPAKHRLFATGYADPTQSQQAFFMIDVSQPTATGMDADHDGIDDRIVWKKVFAGTDVSGVNRPRIDKERGLAYIPVIGGVASRKGRLEVWAIYDNCCDLSANFTAKPSVKQGGNRDSLLRKERDALRAGIAKGLAAAAAKCNVNVSSVTILEQGSGACLWRGHCDDNYQPGLSDHDYEVFVPESAWDTPTADGQNQATCAANELNAVFTDPVTSEPKPVTLASGDTMTFEDITFFPEVRERFESATFDVEGPSSSGTDAVGDMGLGRRSLLLKWLLEGAYVSEVPGYSVEGRSLDAILTDLKNVTKIPRLEGFEWSVLQDFALAKSKAFLRIAGASQPDSAFHKLFVKQLHDAGKAGIRATMARLVANPATNALVLDVTRQGFDTNACYDVSPTVTNPGAWPEKPCSSFEEYVASAAARSLRQNLGVFTYDEVVNQAHRFFRVKSDRERIVSERAADAFIALAARFIAASKTLTQPIYDQTLPSDRDVTLRVRNMGTAQGALASALKEAKLPLVPHISSRGFRNGSNIRVALYKTDGPGSGQIDKETRINIAGGEDLYLDYVRDASGAIALANGKAQPVFQIKVDLTTGFSQPHGVSLLVDLPDRTMKESNRQNNLGGFFYYVLDRQAGSTPATPSAPYFPLADTSVLDPSPECYESPTLMTTQFVQAGGENLTDEAILGRGEAITITLTVQNTSSSKVTGVVACSNITNKCYSMGDLEAGQSATKTIDYVTPDEDTYLDGTPSAYSPVSGVLTGASSRLIVNGNAYVIQPLMDEAEVRTVKPDLLDVQLGGTAIRHYRIVGRRSGQPKPNMTVTAELQGFFGANEGTRTLTFSTNQRGEICTPTSGTCSTELAADDRGLQVVVEPSMQTSTTYRLRLTQVNGQPIAPENATEFSFGLTDRDYSQSYAVGSSIEGTLLTVSGSAEDGFELSRSGKFLHGPEKLGLSLSEQVGATGKVEFSLFPSIKAKVGVGELKLEGKASTSEAKTPSAEGSEYEFGYVPNADTRPGQPPFILDQSSQCAISALTLQHFVSKSPLVSKVLDLLRESPCNTDLSRYLVGSSKELSWSSTDSASVGLSFKSALTREAESKLSVKVGADGGASAGFSTKHESTFEWDTAQNKSVMKTEKHAYSMFGKVNFSIGLSANFKPEEEEDDKDKLEVKTFENALKTSFSQSTSDSYGVSFEYEVGKTTPKSVKITYAGPKLFGWKGNIGGEGTGAITLGTGAPSRSLSYTLTRPDDIARAVETLANIKAVENTVSQQQLAALEIGYTPTLLNQELGKFRGLLFHAITPYTETESRGTGVEIPIGLEGKWLGLGLGASLTGKTEAKTPYPVTVGVNYKGRTLPLQKYKKDDYLPNVDLSLGDFIGHLWSATADSFDTQFSHVGAPITPGGPPQTLKSTMTATMTIDPSHETAPFDAALYSYHYRSIPGPVRDGAMLPSDAAGPAGLPHFGIGGFHNFSPEGRQLATPVPLVIDYKDDEVENFDESTFGIYGWNTETQDWEHVGGTVNAAANTVTATVDRLRLYTIAPRMPAGTIALTITDEGQVGTGESATHKYRVTTGQLTNNDGTPVADGTLYTVRSLVNATNLTADFGSILAQDADAARDNLQLAVVNGHLEFEVEYSSPGGFFIPGRVVIYSTTGTAFGARVVNGGQQ